MSLPRTSYSVVEFAEMEGVSASTVHRWIRDGEIEFIVRNGMRRIPARVVNALTGDTP